MNWYELLFYKYIKGVQGQPKLRIMMPVFKGGTEQVLPENGSTPTTAPIIADIRYPDALRTDQTFLYRESPTQESGNARLRRIKGNTLGWNQLVPSLSTMSAQNGTLSVADNVATITSSSSVTYLGIATSGSSIVLPKGGHKYLLTVEVNSSKALTSCNLAYGSNVVSKYNVSANTWTKISGIASSSDPTGQFVQLRIFSSFEQGDTLQVRNWNYFDLTAMGLDSLTEDEFTSLFPLPFYDFNQGSLLSFMGNGIKTTGKNLLESANLQIGKNWTKGSAVDRTIIEFAVEGNKEYTISFDYSSNILNAILVFRTGWNTGQIGNSDIGTAKEYTFTTPSTCKVVCVQFNARVSGFVLSSSDFYGFWNCALTDTFSTKALPVSTYFPTGMKSAGTVYDELTESKAITRVESVDLGTLTWLGGPWNGHYRYNASVPNINTSQGDYTNGIVCSSLTPSGYPITGGSQQNNVIAKYSGQVFVATSDYTSASAFKQAMVDQNVKLYYELATPTETPITTEDANEALSLLMGKSVSSNNAKQMIDIITKGE